MINKIVLTAFIITISSSLGAYHVNPVIDSNSIASQSIDQSIAEWDDVQWYSMREAQIKATTSGKKVLVYIYAEWCVWCQKMDNKTYAEIPVRQEISKYYYPVRIDGESSKEIVFNNQKMTMQEFAKSLGVTAYPTTLFIDEDGSIIAQQGGYIKPDVFVKLLSFVGSDAYQSQEFDQFTSNDRPE